MLKRVSLLALLSLGVSLPTFAETNFCNSGDHCVEIKIQNSSSALVKSVKFTQQTNKGKCEDVEKTATQNLTGGTSTSESYNIFLKADCGYKIKFKTTSGCTGNKSKQISSEQLENGLKSLTLKGACGSLKVKKK